jgi:hypothetical protein
MKKIISTVCLSCLFLIGCSVEPVTPPVEDNGCAVIPEGTITSTSSKEFDEALLAKLFEAVYFESQSKFCQRGDQWGFAGVGAKPCGGPMGYMPYKKYNEKCFLNVLTRYNQQSHLYNNKYQIASNCLVEPEPESVVCKEGKPVLVY